VKLIILLKIIKKCILYFRFKILNNIKNGDWGLGIGDWGLGIGDGGLGIGDLGLVIVPNPQSPIPNPQSPIPNPHLYFKIFKIVLIILNLYLHKQ